MMYAAAVHYGTMPYVAAAGAVAAAAAAAATGIGVIIILEDSFRLCSFVHV